MEGIDPSRPKYFSADEVAQHFSEDDIWVSFLGHVYDLTSFVSEHRGNTLIKPIIEVAGQDISSWFDSKTRDIRTKADKCTGCIKPDTPQGRFIHIPPNYPCSKWRTDFGMPWWRSPTYRIGVLSKGARNIRILNTHTSELHTIQVCEEETLYEIQRRFNYINRHTSGYDWMVEDIELDMSKTLAENGVENEDEEFAKYGLDEELYRPTIRLHFRDDLLEI